MRSRPAGWGEPFRIRETGGGKALRTLRDAANYVVDGFGRLPVTSVGKGPTERGLCAD